MAKLTEIAEFIDSVLRLDKDTPVRGYDPDTGALGESNEQAQVLANRTTWLKEKLETILLQYVVSINGASGALTLDYSDVGADKAGTAAQKVADHEAEPDPHPGYLNELRGDYRYLKQILANKPLGWLQLDDKGKLPASVADALKTRYVVVDTEAERLALPVHDDLTICAQLNGAGNADDQLYYLNGGADPSDPDAWILGSSAVLSGVSSIFGRTGMIVAEAGDYNAGQITETPDRVFLTPAEKQSIAQKQDQLQSGVNVKTLHGKSLLGSGNIELDFNDVGADSKGSAGNAITQHKAELDPHTQYLNESRGDGRYVKQDTANKPLGYVQLDSSGRLPVDLVDILKARYVIVQDDAERFALPLHDNLTIAMQLNGPTDDDDQLWYLNGGDDPADTTKWIKGQQAVAVGVTSIFGRSGMVLAQAGDYNSDQITETANKLFITPAEKTAYAGKEDKGAGAAAVVAHEAKADPHPDYYNQTRGDARYLRLTESNKANGFLKLDATNKIPAGYIDVLQARHVIVQDDAARLALAPYSNLTIAAQLNGPGEDDDRMYYLNGGLDPSVDANWHKGQSAILQGVPSAFGRTGAIVAEDGDYNADQITETATRLFVSPTEKASWSAKQVQLISGVSIKTVYGQSLMGSGDVTFTPTQIGAAEKVHTHSTTDIVDFTQKSQQLIANSMEAGSGISIGLNPTSGKTTISAANSQGGDGSNYVVVDRVNATAGQNHAFSIQKQSAYNLDAYALKEEPGIKGQSLMQGNFAAGMIGSYVVSGQVLFTGSIGIYRGETLTLSLKNGRYSSPFRKDSAKFSLLVSSSSIVPRMTSNAAPAGYTARASSEYSTNYMAYKAFDQVNAAGVSDGWASIAQPTAAAPQWIAIDLPAAVMVTGYGVQNRYAGENAFASKWKFQGSNDKNTWEDIGSEVIDMDGVLGKVRNHTVSPTKAYSSYRLLITEAQNNHGFVMVQEFFIYSGNNVMFLDDDGTTGYGYSAGALVPYPNVTDAQIKDNGFNILNDIGPALFNGKSINNLVAVIPTTVTLNAIPSAQIVIQKDLTAANIWEKINSATFATTQTGSGKARMAVSRDLINWSVWDGSAWKTIGELTTDKASADKVIAQGMTSAVVTAMTSANWMALYAGSNGVPDNIAFAYAVEITAQSSDVASVERLLLNVDNTSSWKEQSSTEVEVRWRSDSVTFKTITAGNYKLAYQLP